VTRSEEGGRGKKERVVYGERFWQKGVQKIYNVA
jgi:hypothetical protein